MAAAVKRSPLARRTSLRARRRSPRPEEDYAARMAWKEPRQGWCQCGCDPQVFAYHLERHHVIGASKLRELGRYDVLWDQRNSMLLAPHHHERHTSHFSCIRLEVVPVVAREFAVEVLGDGPAEAYFRAHYRTVAA